MFMVARFNDAGTKVLWVLSEDERGECFEREPSAEAIRYFEEYEAWEKIGELREKFPDFNLGTIQTVHTQAMELV